MLKLLRQTLAEKNARKDKGTMDFPQTSEARENSEKLPVYSATGQMIVDKTAGHLFDSNKLLASSSSYCRKTQLLPCLERQCYVTVIIPLSNKTVTVLPPAPSLS